MAHDISVTLSEHDINEVIAALTYSRARTEAHIKSMGAQRSGSTGEKLLVHHLSRKGELQRLIEQLRAARTEAMGNG